jgi:carbon storage regulator
MLVLSRYVGEKILIGEGASQVIVTVLSIDDLRVRLGIEAPEEMPIWREEIAPRQGDLRTAPEQVPDTYQ